MKQSKKNSGCPGRGPSTGEEGPGETRERL